MKISEINDKIKEKSSIKIKKFFSISFDLVNLVLFSFLLLKLLHCLLIKKKRRKQAHACVSYTRSKPFLGFISETRYMQYGKIAAGFFFPFHSFLQRILSTSGIKGARAGHINPFWGLRSQPSIVGLGFGFL